MTPLGISTFLWSAIEAMRIVSSDKKLRLQTGDINRSIGSWNRGDLSPITFSLTSPARRSFGEGG
jgi:hypothetical protein